MKSFNTIEDVKKAVLRGDKVHKKNVGYEVICDKLNRFLIHYIYNNYYVGLQDNEDASKFFVE